MLSRGWSRGLSRVASRGSVSRWITLGSTSVFFTTYFHPSLTLILTQVRGSTFGLNKYTILSRHGFHCTPTMPVLQYRLIISPHPVQWPWVQSSLYCPRFRSIIPHHPLHWACSRLLGHNAAYPWPCARSAKKSLQVARWHGCSSRTGGM